MRRLGFRRGAYNPCLYFHNERNLRTFLHGDDFATVGTREQVSWFKAALEKRFEIMSQCVGPGALKLGGRRGDGTATALAPTSTNGEALIEGTEGRPLNRII